MKRAASPSRLLKYLGWIAPILIIMGLSAGVVSGTWGVLPLSLLLSGVLVLGLWLVSESQAIPGFLGQRSTQVGTNALVATLAMVAILGLINFLAVRWIARVDLTENQLFTLAPQTQQVLADLDEPVELFLFQPGSGPNPVDRELLDNYRRQSDRFSYQWVDPQADPVLANRFAVQNPLGEVHLESGSRRQLVQTLNPNQPLTERQLTNGIVKLLSDRQPTVYFLQGHGEPSLEPGAGGLADAITLLEGENYRVDALDLAQTSEVPDDADVVVIAGPQQALFEAEVDALQDYLDSRSGLLVLLDPQSDPELGDVFADWGIEPVDRLIIDPAGQAVGADITTTLVQEYGEHPITSSFGNNYSFFPGAQPINLDPQEGTESAPLLITSDLTQAFVIPDEGDVELNEDDGLQGPLVFGVALNRPVESAAEPAAPAPSEEESTSATEESEPEPEPEPEPDEAAAESPDETADEAAAETTDEARLVVIGNTNFVLNTLVNQQLNGDVFLNTVNWLSQQNNQAITIRPKEVTNRRIVLDTQRLITVALTAIAILPLIGFGGAVALWLSRR